MGEKISSTGVIADRPASGLLLGTDDFSDQPGTHKIRLGTPKGIGAGRWRSSLGSAGMP